MTGDKEQIYAALFSRLTESMTGVLTFSRRVRTFDDVPPTEQPAVFLEQDSTQTIGEGGQPLKQLVKANILIYAYADDAQGPMPIVNGLVGQVEAALKRHANEAAGPWSTSLGGKVSSARPTSVTYAGGNLGTQGIAIVSVEMLTTT